MRVELADARAGLRTLKARLGQNSKNSSKPPSSDGMAKPAPTCPRGKSGRGPGRPKGQPGARPAQVSDPDHGQEHQPEGPRIGCGAGPARRRSGSSGAKSSTCPSGSGWRSPRTGWSPAGAPAVRPPSPGPAGGERPGGSTGRGRRLPVRT
ncbi:DUF6444 domain-containing protein [Streptomyces sp. NPDC048479]|uniref:DUF6444 domain-containing protein n=1 Tax=Streptomyces sp. NPDC048479 TaxID=3154725 RepID=UPI0034358191